MRPASTLAASRLAVAFQFFAMGLFFGTWVAHIPGIQSRFSLSEAELGTLLLVIAAGAVLVMFLSSALIQRFGSHVVSVAGALVAAVSLPLAFLTPTTGWLAAALFVFGGGGGALDVSMNDQAVLVQRRFGRPIMSSFHALFSVGGLVGAAAGALVLRLGGTPTQQAAASALLVAAAVLRTSRHLIEERGARTDNPLGLAADRRLLTLSLLIFLCFMSEGVVADWAALYLRDHAGASASAAPLGFAAFSLTMTVGRLTGDRVIQRLGPRTTAAGGGLLAAAGTALALVLPDAASATVGFALVGAGLANLVPMMFSKAGNVPGLPSSAGLATVSVAGYGALLAGPPLVGYLAELTSLPAALRLLVLSGLVVTAAAPAFVPHADPSEPRP